VRNIPDCTPDRSNSGDWGVFRCVQLANKNKLLSTIIFFIFFLLKL
jgi:hypothetical protein